MKILMKIYSFELIELNSIQKKKLCNIYFRKLHKEKYLYKYSNTILTIRNSLNRYLSYSEMNITSIGFDKIDEYIFIKFLFSTSQQDLIQTIKNFNFMTDFPIDNSTFIEITKALINFILIYIDKYNLVLDNYICDLLINEEKEE